ncbi:mucin-5AC-like [Maniola jurtina]|uniref:mucin-5AC-like n=1 Tax=Maniola jurtina TaxID=191418 RepID=UPI001E68EC28|nr:mucin-5AC-like [Maniola jurtina]
MHASHSHSAQSLESASWPKDSTSYAGLASPTNHDEPMMSPQPSTSYAAAAAAPPTPRPAAPTAPQREPPTTAPATATGPSQPAPRSSYPPLVVECLPNWTRHFEALRRILGHAPNARPLGRGMRFLPKSAEEFRAVQRYLTEAAAQDSAISWYCYSPASEIPTKVAIRGLPLETPTEEVVAALGALGFPAEAARALPPPRGKHGCTYYVRLAHMSQEELRELFATTELLNMPQVTVEAWRGGSKPPQCHRCQLFSHNSVNCHRPFRCVRCAGPHSVRDCTRSREEPPTCANCGQNHAANDRRCSFYKREARRRGIAIPPPPPRASAGRQQQKRGTTTAPTTAPPPTSATVPPTTTAPSASTAAPPTTSTARTTAQSAAHPTTLVAAANPPTERGQPVQGRRKRKRNRIPRPRRTEPTAASTPQPRQTRVVTANTEPPSAGPTQTTQMPPTQRTAVPNVETGNEPPVENSEQRRAQRFAPRFSQPPTVPPTSTPRFVRQSTQAPSAAPMASQQTQGEEQTNPDLMAIVRVVMEAIMTGLTTYLQGQGVIPAITAGMAVLARLHSY